MCHAAPPLDFVTTRAGGERRADATAVTRLAVRDRVVAPLPQPTQSAAIAKLPHGQENTIRPSRSRAVVSILVAAVWSVSGCSWTCTRARSTHSVCEKGIALHHKRRVHGLEHAAGDMPNGFSLVQLHLNMLDAVTEAGSFSDDPPHVRQRE